MRFRFEDVAEVSIAMRDHTLVGLEIADELGAMLPRVLRRLDAESLADNPGVRVADTITKLSSEDRGLVIVAASHLASAVPPTVTRVDGPSREGAA